MTRKPSPVSSRGAFEPGSVVLVPFPYSDRLGEKRRPALIVSGEALATSGFLWALMITTAKRGLQPYDVPIDDLEGAGLPVACVVRPTKIACIEASRVLRRSGRLPSEAAERVLQQVRSFLGAGSGAPTPREA